MAIDDLNYNFFRQSISRDWQIFTCNLVMRLEDTIIVNDGQNEDRHTLVHYGSTKYYYSNMKP